jgi:IPT/TIG domain
MHLGRIVACSVLALGLALGGLAYESASHTTTGVGPPAPTGPGRGPAPSEVALPGPTGPQAPPPPPTGPEATPAPVVQASVTSIAPRTGSSGSQVTISGTGFIFTEQVCFGIAASPHYRVSDSGTRITAVVPPGSGTVPVAVITAAGPSPLKPGDTFTYRTSTIASGAARSTPVCASMSTETSP